MADTDPFGRREGEDPLAEMGWSTAGAIKPHEGPADVADPERPDRAAARRARGGPARGGPARDVPAPFGARRTRGTAGCALTVFVVGFLIAVSAVVVPLGLEAVDEVEEDPATPTVVDEPPDGERRDGPPRGLERASLLRRENLAPALRRLRRVTGASRVDLVRVDATSVLVTTSLGGDRTRLARATWDGEAEVLSTASGGGGRPTFGWSQIDAAAPARIVRAATRGRPSRAFDYLVLLDANGLGWSAFLRGGGTFSAAPDGSAVSRVG